MSFLKLDLNKLLKELGPIKTLIYIIVLGFVLLTLFALFRIVKNLTNKEQPTPDSNQTKLMVEGIGNNCSPVLSFTDNNEWSFTGYKHKNNSYCAVTKKEIYPLIWYKSLVPTLLTSFAVSYRIPENIVKLPPFVLAIGKDPKLLYLYFHENNIKIIGVSRSKLINNNEVKFVRELPLEIPEMPLPNSIALITLRGILKGNNKITYFLNYEYVPALRPNTKEEYPQSFDVYLADPSLGKEISIVEIGIGTLSGSCFQPLTYQLCQ